MRKTIDCVLTALMSAFLTFAWCRYLLKNNIIATLASCVVGLCIGYIALFVGDKTQRKNNATKQKKSTLAALSQMLTFGTDNAAIFQDLLTYYGYKCSTSDNGEEFIAEHDGKRFLVTLCFFDDKLNAATLRRTVVNARRADCNGLLVFCHNTDGGATSSAQKASACGVEVKVFDIADICELMTQADKMPALPTIDGNKRVGIVGTYAFCRKRASQYLLATAFLVAVSFVSYIKLYNLLWASALFALGMYSLFNKRYNTRKTASRL